MPQKKDQHNVGSKAKPRGQQMGRAGTPDQNRERKKATPARSGGRIKANKMFGDTSTQNIGGDAVTPESNSPSTVTREAGANKGESSGETAFKARLKQKRSR
ncbi:MAG TPA: hypothetical protein VIW64_06805 [Pyrinomonadaceae bacterium]|jgi:hypothetical protein